MLSPSIGITHKPNKSTAFWFLLNFLTCFSGLCWFPPSSLCMDNHWDYQVLLFDDKWQQMLIVFAPSPNCVSYLMYSAHECNSACVKTFYMVETMISQILHVCNQPVLQPSIPSHMAQVGFCRHRNNLITTTPIHINVGILKCSCFHDYKHLDQVHTL